MATEQGETWETEEMQDLFETLLELETIEDLRHFLRDLCTIGELEAMSQRWQVARLLAEGLPYQEISRRTGSSTATVTRVAHWLKHGEGGYRLVLEKKATTPTA
jgi:TrpR-related protein YerC/YecD